LHLRALRHDDVALFVARERPLERLGSLLRTAGDRASCVPCFFFTGSGARQRAAVRVA
jgi:hypothetical protein